MQKALNTDKEIRNEARYWRNDTHAKLDLPNGRRRLQGFLERVIALHGICPALQELELELEDEDWE